MSQHFRNGWSVRLNRTPFSEEWEAVQVDASGLIVWRAPIHPDDAATLERHYQESRSVITDLEKEAGQ